MDCDQHRPMHDESKNDMTNSIMNYSIIMSLFISTFGVNNLLNGNNCSRMYYVCIIIKLSIVTMYIFNLAFVLECCMYFYLVY